MRSLEIDGVFSAAKAEDNLLVEVGIRQEAWFHARGPGIERRAASNFA